MDFTLAPITIQQIMVFLCVVEYGGFAKASNYLHMTQSAVSKSVAKLEKELGILLFQRTTREVCLTDAGQILYDDWAEQVRLMQGSYMRAKSMQTKEDTILRIGLLNTARPERYFWPLEQQLKQEHPEIVLELGSEYMVDLEDKLENGRYDAIMIPDFERFTAEEKGMSWKWAARSNACVLLPENHPLASKVSLETKDILYEDFVTLRHERGENYQRDLEERFAPYGAKPKVQYHYRNAYEIRYLFLSGHSALIMVDDYFDFPDMPGVVRIPLMDQKNGIICVWNPENRKTSLEKLIHVLSSRVKKSDIRQQKKGNIPFGNK